MLENTKDAVIVAIGPTGLDAETVSSWGGYLYFSIGFWFSFLIALAACLWLVLGVVYLFWMYIEDRKTSVRIPCPATGICNSGCDYKMGGGAVASLFLGGIFVSLLSNFAWPAILILALLHGLTRSAQGVRALRRWTKKERKKGPDVDAKFQEMFPARR